jgi:hypothetical protein
MMEKKRENIIRRALRYSGLPIVAADARSCRVEVAIVPWFRRARTDPHLLACGALAPFDAEFTPETDRAQAAPGSNSSER